LVPQFFANKPVEHLLGPGIEAGDITDDCLDRTLDWLYGQDPTQLFAGIATQTRQIFSVSARHVHVDPTSFAVRGSRHFSLPKSRLRHQRALGED